MRNNWEVSALNLTNGLVKDFLDLLGFTATTPDGVQLAFTVTSVLLGMVIVTTMVLIFKLLCYFRSH